MRRAFLGALAAALLLAVVPGMAQARGGKLVFAGTRLTGASALYVVGGDGHGRRRLAHTGKTDSYPVWSPNGRSVAFSRSRSIDAGECFAATRDDICSEEEVFVMGADGSGLRQVTDVDYRDPCSSTQMDIPFGWSPDGGSVLFSSNRWDGRDISQPGTCNGAQLWRVGTGGGAATQVTRSPGMCQGDTAAAWASTGQIAFASVRDCSDNVWTVASGGTLHRITANHADNVSFADVDYSPSGKSLAVARTRTGKSGETRFDLYVMRSDGSGSRRVATNAAFPAWSPSGRSIGFFKFGGGGFGIYRVAPRGGKVHRVASLRGFASISRLDWAR